MHKASIFEAKTHLSKLVERALKGEDVLSIDERLDGFGVRREW